MRRIYGYALLILACVCWALIPVVPILDFSAGVIAGTVTVLVILGEVFFWVGIVLLGKELYNKLKGKLNPCRWFCKKPAETQDKKDENINSS